MKNRCILCILLPVALLYSCNKSTIKEDENNITHSTAPITFNPALSYGTMTDQEGNSYKTITIGTQTWMAENLHTTKYSNGDPIANYKGTSGITPIGGYYSDYDNQPIYAAIYGRLYAISTVWSNKNLAPPGWKIPGDADWKTLICYLDTNTIIIDDFYSGFTSQLSVGKLKESGSEHWGGLLAGTNESGFTALPGGCRYPAPNNQGSYYSGIGVEAYWWSSDGHSAHIVGGAMVMEKFWLPEAASVRCIRIN